MSEAELKCSNVQDMVDQTWLPRNIVGLKRFCDPPLRFGLDALQFTDEQSRALEVFREISHVKLSQIASSEEESSCSYDSHVDSEDSGLFKDGYIFERKIRPTCKDAVNKKVKNWKKTASEQVENINKIYKHGLAKNKETFSSPLGLEANQRIVAQSPDESSNQSQSKKTSECNSEEEMDIRGNDEFMREVCRVLRRKKTPQTLKKRSLPEEYSRLIFKKTARLTGRDRPRTLALMEKGESLNENTDTGADGDQNCEPTTEIFEQLTKMVLKSKIAKNSEAAQQQDESLRRVERRIWNGADASDVDNEMIKDGKKINGIINQDVDPQLEPNHGLNCVDLKAIHNGDLLVPKHDEFLRVSDHNNRKCRLKKVETYLSSLSDVWSMTDELPEINEMTSECEQTLFDSLSRDFLKDMAPGHAKKNQITRKDKKLLTIIAKRYIDRGALTLVDDLMNSNLNESIRENVNGTDREEFILKKIMKKFIKCGMRDILEDLIAWIYYKLDTKKIKPAEQMQDENAVQSMVKAFINSGKNPYLNRIVSQLTREHRKTHPSLDKRQIGDVEEQIKGVVVARFARVYMEQIQTTDRNTEPSGVNVNNEFEKKSGTENFDVNGRYVQIEWTNTSGESEQPITEHEINEESSIQEKSSCRINLRQQNHNREGVNPELQKDMKFVNETLKDIVWEVQQRYHRHKPGKPNRTCSLVRKRSATVIGENIRRGKFNPNVLERKMNFEERRKQMREEHAKWLMDQKEILKDARKKYAKNMGAFMQSVPERLEKIIAKRNSSLKQPTRRD